MSPSPFRVVIKKTPPVVAYMDAEAFTRHSFRMTTKTSGTFLSASPKGGEIHECISQTSFLAPGVTFFQFTTAAATKDQQTLK